MKTITLAGAGVLFVAIIIAVLWVFQVHTEKAMNSADAIDAVIAVYPELKSYKTTSLPPSSIEVEPAIDGWKVGFIQSGSGVPGILHALCYYVASDRKVSAIGEYSRTGNAVVEKIDLTTCAPIGITPEPATTTPQRTIHAYGSVTLALNEIAYFKDLSIQPLTIEEDSRCPSNVECIQAGTVRVKIRVVSGMGTSTSIIKLGEKFTTEGEAITLLDVVPTRLATKTLAPSDYRLTINVVPQGTPVANNPAGKCYVGGCSAQLCTDEPNVASTCEYTAAYACYKTAACERQSDGKCGWTQTATLAACLAGAR